LREWERLRLETDLGNHHLFWIGDGLGESLLPKETDSSLVSRWEWLARSLDRQIHTDLLGYAFRDAIALSAALGSAFILTHRSPEDRARNLPPVICSTLESWGINCQEIDQQDAIATLDGISPSGSAFSSSGSNQDRSSSQLVRRYFCERIGIRRLVRN
jgi:hypothetical protein